MFQASHQDDLHLIPSRFTPEVQQCRGHSWPADYFDTRQVLQQRGHCQTASWGKYQRALGTRNGCFTGMRPHNQSQWATWLTSASWKQGATLWEGMHCCSTVLPVGRLLSGSNSGRLLLKGSSGKKATGRSIKCGHATCDLFGKCEC